MQPHALRTEILSWQAAFCLACLSTGALDGKAQTGAATSLPPQAPPREANVTFHKNFEGGSLGRVEQLATNHFRCHVEGQADERGRNRQATWYFFRMDGARGRDLTLTLTNFVGEYNDRPGAVSMNAETIPVFSQDGEHWQHFPAMTWNNQTKEATLQARAEKDSLWIAHVPPYLLPRLDKLLADVRSSPHARVRVLGQSVQGRDLHLVTVTDPAPAAAAKPCLWLIARQHAWEAPTSFVMEGALRFITSDDPAARALRARVDFQFVPLMGPDGVAGGQVRFNAHGYDVNRHWDDPAWRGAEFRQRMPEIASVKQALFDHLDAGGRIDLVLNLHNTETTEFLETQADDPAVLALMRRLHDTLAARTTFDPSSPLGVNTKPISDTNSLWRQRKVPVVLMEQRISASPKLGRRLTVEDRLQFGRALLAAMADAVAP